ncbi:MAG: ABC transporter ATP-binding protein [Lachnospiraceae bacterium]|nr:ABC transporter ATP-binding protein [Lachnospiraceae bacterium]
MIEAVHVKKNFDKILAVDDISATIQEGSVFGLIGTNGAGKSTFMRMMCGVLKPDEGKILVDGIPVYENEQAKEKIFYISDDQYYFSTGTPDDILRYYRTVYPAFDEGKCRELLGRFGLETRRKIHTFSKGMKKQLSVLMGICANTKYLLCDETFDGLDPVMRQAVKSIFVNEMEERGMTPIIASHNLRELEDICDHVGLLHRGGILLSKDLEDMKCNIHKLQCVFSNPEDIALIEQRVEVIRKDQRGQLYTLTIRGMQEEIERQAAELNPVFYEVLPLSLEEIFISETEVVGYDIKNLIF